MSIKGVQIFTATGCPNCDYAKELLAQKGIAFTPRDISTNDYALDDFIKFGFQTVPQIVAAGEVIGGYSELKTRLNADQSK